MVLDALSESRKMAETCTEATGAAGGKGGEGKGGRLKPALVPQPAVNTAHHFTPENDHHMHTGSVGVGPPAIKKKN